MGRAMAYRLGPEPTARKRIDELRRQRLSGMQRLSGIPESAAEQSELAELEQRYPSVIDIDIDPPRPEDHRLFEALEGSRKAVEQARREQAEALSRGEDPRKVFGYIDGVSELIATYGAGGYRPEQVDEVYLTARTGTRLVNSGMISRAKRCRLSRDPPPMFTRTYSTPTARRA